MNKGNTYIFIYATIMVIVVAAILSIAATALKPYQLHNVKIEKMRSILTSIDVESNAANAESLYKKYITETFVINSNGKTLKGDAFTVNMKKEIAKDLVKRGMPLYKSSQTSGNFLIVPMLGKGLWGPVSGYVALKEESKTLYATPADTVDVNAVIAAKVAELQKKHRWWRGSKKFEKLTAIDPIFVDSLYKTKEVIVTSYNSVSGVYFDHEKETPGLGAEISNKDFQEQFIGKKIFDADGNFKGIAVKKSAVDKNDPHAVDGISGGTLTGDGVQAMLFDCISFYKDFLANN